jgi:cell division septum initiation protein DivIVA
MRSKELLEQLEHEVHRLKEDVRELRDDMDLMMAVIKKAKEAGTAEAPKAAGRKKNVKSAE